MRRRALVRVGTVQQPGSGIFSQLQIRPEPLTVRSCSTEPRESTSCKPSSRWWVLYVRSQQIRSWVSNSAEATIWALIIKTSHDYYKRYFRLANVEGVSVWGKWPGMNVILSLPLVQCAKKQQKTWKLSQNSLSNGSCIACMLLVIKQYAREYCTTLWCRRTMKQNQSIPTDDVGTDASVREE